MTSTTTTPLSREQRRTKIEKILTQFIYYGLPIIVAITLIRAMSADQNIANKGQKRRAENGFNIFVIVLFIKPISILGRKYAHARIIKFQQGIDIIKDIITTNKRHQQRIKILNDLIKVLIDTIFSISCYLMRFRRQLGLLTFRFLFTHATLLQIFRYRADFPLFFNIGETQIITGIIGIIALLVGAITSNNISMRILKKDRKTIQMITIYIGFAFAAFHTDNVFTLILLITLKYFESKEVRNEIFLAIGIYIKKFIQIGSNILKKFA